MSSDAEDVALRPLTWPPSGQPGDSRFERYCMWVPILGWCAAAIHWYWRARPVVRHIERQLERRPEIVESNWSGGAERRTFGRWLSGVIAKEMTWVNDRFVEEDPFEILCWSHDDGLDCEFVLQHVEARTNRRYSQKQVLHLLTLTLGDAVDYFLSSEVGGTGCQRAGGSRAGRHVE